MCVTSNAVRRQCFIKLFHFLSHMNKCATGMALWSIWGLSRCFWFYTLIQINIYFLFRWLNYLACCCICIIPEILACQVYQSCSTLLTTVNCHVMIWGHCIAKWQKENALLAQMSFLGVPHRLWERTCDSFMFCLDVCCDITCNSAFVNLSDSKAFLCIKWQTGQDNRHCPPMTLNTILFGWVQLQGCCCQAHFMKMLY